MNEYFSFTYIITFYYNIIFSPLFSRFLLLYIINFYYNIIFSPFFSILIVYIFRFLPFFVLFNLKTYIFYYDNDGPP